MVDQNIHVMAALRQLNNRQEDTLLQLAAIAEVLDNADIRTTDSSTSDDDIYAGELTPTPSSDEEEDSDESTATVAVGFPIASYERKVKEAAEFVFCALVGFFSAAVVIPIILAYFHAHSRPC